MSRAVVSLNWDQDKLKAIEWIRKAPWGSRIEFKGVRRSLPQNAKFWSLLTDVASQHEHHGRKYDTETWKQIFLHAWGRETSFIPSLSGAGLIPVYRSSDLSRAEMSSLIEFIVAWATENGVKIHDEAEANAA